jgi:hypothetical protein
MSILDHLSLDELGTATAPSNESQAGRSLRSNTLDIGASLNTLAGAVGDKFGATDYARGRFAKAQELSAEAAAGAPRVSSFRDINNLRDAMDYGAGILGGSIPYVAGALGVTALTGGAALPAIAGNAALMAPIETGDVLRRQQADGQPLSLRDAALTGLGSAAVQGIIPGLAGAKLAGRAAAGGLRSEMGKAVLGEGLTEAAGEGVKQFGSGQVARAGGLDTDQLAESFVGGAVGGAPFGAMGALGGARQAIGEGAGKAAGLASKAVGAAREKAAGALNDAPGMSEVQEGLSARSQEIADALDSLTGRVRGRASGAVDAVSQGFPAGFKDLAGKSGDELTRRLKQLDEETIPKVAEWAKGLMDDAGFDEGKRAQVAEAAKDLSSEANRTAIAGFKKARDAARDAGENVARFYESMKKGAGKTLGDLAEGTGVERKYGTKAAQGLKDLVAATKAAGGAKKSEDFSGFRQALLDDVAPMILESNPALADNPRAMNDLADGLRMFVEQVAKRGPGQMDSDTVASMVDLLGEKSGPILDRVFKLTKNEDPAQAENFFGALNQIEDNRKRDTSTFDVLAKNLKPELQGEYTTRDLRELTSHLKGWVSRTSDGSERGRYNDRRINEMLAQTFDKPDAVIAALRKGMTDEQNVFAKDALETDEEGNPIETDSVDYTDVLTEGGPQRSLISKKAVPSPEAHKAEYGNEGQAERLIKEAKARDKGLEARWVSVGDFHRDEGSAVPDELMVDRTVREEVDGEWVTRTERVPDPTKGYVVAEKMAGSDRLTPEQAASFKFDSSKGDRRKSASIVDAGEGVQLDGMKLGRQRSGEELPWNAADDKGSMVRLQRQVLENVAALQDTLGRKFKVPDTTVVARRGGADITWGEIKGLKQSTEERTGLSDGESADARVTRLQKQLNALELKMLKAPPDERREMRESWEKLRAQLDQAIGADNVTREMERRGQSELPLDANIHEVEALGKVEPIRTSMDGTPISHRPRKSPKEILAQREAKVGRREEPAPAAAPDVDAAAKQAAWVTKAFAREDAKAQIDKLTQPQLEALANYLDDAIENGERPPGISAMRFKTLQQYVSERAYNMEGAPDPKVVAAKKAAFLEKARSGDAALIETLKASNDVKGLQRAAQALRGAKDDGSRKTLDAINERLSALLQNPEAEYAAQIPKYSAAATNQQHQSTQAQRAKVKDYIDRVLGPSVTLEWKNLFHAGEFDATTDTIRVSVHSLNPMSTAHHEALHAWFKQLGEQRQYEVMRPLYRAADTAHVKKQLRELLASEPAALKQLSDAEERVAYMYQFWAAGKLRVGPDTKGVLEKIKDFFRRILGTWSNDERALRTLEYFESGDYQAERSDPAAVLRATVEAGRNETLDRLAALTKPLTSLADALTSAGSQRLNDTGVPALRELATLVRASGREDGVVEDPGFLPAARAERTRLMNQVGEALRDFTPGEMSEALKAMQSGAIATGRAADVQRLVQGADGKSGFLRVVFNYMRDAGVDVNELGGRYFPRVYSSDYISRHQKEFVAVLEKHGLDPAAAQDVLRKLIAADGVELKANIMRPGMQNLKQRVLANIPDAELQPFMEKDMLRVLGSYTAQAARRAEWARRFDDDNAKLSEILAQAETQGASLDEVDTARKFLMGVDGTLGDDINPDWRRLQGNLIVYQNVRLLPMAIFSSAVDPLGVMVRGGTVRDAWRTFTRGIREIPKTFQNDPTFDADTELAEQLGVIDDAMLSHTMGELYTQGMVGDTARKINDAFFRYNLMEGFSRSMRVGATRAAVNFITRHADGKGEHSKRWLAELGLEVGNVPKRNGQLDVTDPKVAAAVNQWVDGAVLRPDAATKPIWMNDPRYAIFAHLKQFMYAFHEVILKRVMHEFQAGNYKPAMVLSSYVPVMLAADFVKGMAQGGGEQPEWKRGWTAADYAWSATQRAGLLGVSQFAVDLADPAQLAGPTVEQLADAARVMGGQEGLGSFMLKSMPANALYKEAASAP